MENAEGFGTKWIIGVRMEQGCRNQRSVVYIRCLINTFRCKNCKLGGPQGWAFLSKIDKVDQRSHCPAQVVAAVGNAGLRHAEVESVCARVCVCCPN